MTTFEVIGPDGRGKMRTHALSCLPTVSEIKSMASCGYKFKLDGKTVSKSVVIQLLTQEYSKSDQVSSDGMNDRLF